MTLEKLPHRWITPLTPLWDYYMQARKETQIEPANCNPGGPFFRKKETAKPRGGSRVWVTPSVSRTDEQKKPLPGYQHRGVTPARLGQKKENKSVPRVCIGGREVGGTGGGGQRWHHPSSNEGDATFPPESSGSQLLEASAGGLRLLLKTLWAILGGSRMVSRPL